MARYPHLPLLMTTMTPTGAVRVKTAFGDRVHHVYVPYDVPSAMQRFLTAMKPKLGIIMETELWPNLLHACHQKKIPVCLINARLSVKSAAGYARIASMTRVMLQQLDWIAAHGEADANRFIALGASTDRMLVTGNIKFDLELPPQLMEKSEALRTQLGASRFIWIAASTHEGEETIVLEAHQRIRVKNPEAILILVPRHPDRFDSIYQLCAQQFVTTRRSNARANQAEAAVYLGDTMGELLLMFGAADVAFIGGSLIPRGGHNMLEPGALGKPILTGPHLFNFAEISNMFVAAGALTKVSDSQSLADQVLMLMQHPEERARMGEHARQVVEANRGALAKQMALLTTYLEPSRAGKEYDFFAASHEKS